jgi:hypothetical protein
MADAEQSGHQYTVLFREPGDRVDGSLSGGYLATEFFPLVICPEKTDAVMILPARSWPEELCEFWAGERG